MISDPSADAEESCGRCHANIVNNFDNSLHSSFTGYTTMFEARSGLSLEANHELKEEFEAECGSCHTTCGQCHISRPKSVNGGLVQGHRFLPSPSQSMQCTACHGSRVGEEYSGSREGYAADVHYVPSGMNCMACHSGDEMHGTGTDYPSRYHSQEMPRCESCHIDDMQSNSYHQLHGEDFACQVCHSQDYKSCNDCHVGGDGISESSYLSYKMGKNPIPNLRDYEYVVLRHIPISHDTYSPWGVGGLDNFADLPTWKYASPHNIKLWTERTDTTGGLSCNESCHNTPDEGGFFLRQADIDAMTPLEAQANAAYIVPDGPPPWN